MAKIKLLFLLLFTILFSSAVYSATEIIIVEDNYGDANYLLSAYFLGAFIFWLFIYFQLPKFAWDEKNLTKSIAIYSSYFICWGWFISLFWTFTSILFISTAEDFLENKLYIFNNLLFLSGIAFGFIALIMLIKYYSKFSGVDDFFKKLIFEIKNGGND